VGQCGPVSHIYNGLLVNSLCEDIVNPFNGQWSQLGLALLFLIPGLFLICFLDGMFRKQKRETGRFYNSGEFSILKIPKTLVKNAINS